MRDDAFDNQAAEAQQQDPPVPAACTGQCRREGQLTGGRDMVLSWPHGSVRPARSRQQLLGRNHTVTEPGREFQLDKALKAKSQIEGNQKVPRRSANHLLVNARAPILWQGGR